MSTQKPPETVIGCPVCTNSFKQGEIEEHVNKCLFLNSTDKEKMDKRKRSPSPVLVVKGQPKLCFSQKSPRDKVKCKLEVNKSENLAPLFKKTMPSTSSKERQSEPPKPDFTFKTPLAVQVRPKSLDDFHGQDKILGKGTVLRALLEKNEIPNMMLWGPPGCGKTSLAHVIQGICKKEEKKWRFVTMCAASCGIKEVGEVILRAKNEGKFGKRTVLFMDEIHRFNKKQQDVFLYSVEKGEIILIGATTENPSFSINSALLSRCRVIVLEKLSSEDLLSILENAAEKFNVDVIVCENFDDDTDADDGLAMETSALKWIADVSDGDARTALGNLQLVLSFFEENSSKLIKQSDIEDKLKRAHLLYDKTGEEHYNIISAMHKSIRGSDANAALYWTTRMIVSGEDPRFIARRLVRTASEDIGNADPNALSLAIATMQGCQLIGMPEADVLLAQCAIYLARAPKSREADTALARAKRLIEQHKGPQPVVPMHIRNAPTKLMQEMGYGQLAEESECIFMPPEYKDVDFFR